MSIDQEIMKIGANAATFIRNQVRKLDVDVDDDEKMSIVMVVTGITSAIFIEAFSEANQEPRSHVIKNFIQSIEGLLDMMKEKSMN